MKKNILFLLVSVIYSCYSGLNAQEASQVIEKYTRNSLSIVHTYYDDTKDREIMNFYASNISLSERFDKNEISLKTVSIQDRRTQYSSKTESYLTPDRSKEIARQLNQENAGLMIISYIFNRQEDGSMNLDRIFQRGDYSAVDADITLAESLKRGVDVVKDDGMQLIGRSYLLVLDYMNFLNKEKRTENHLPLIKEGDLIGYLFQIDWNDTIKSQIYDCWIDENTPDNERNAKKKQFEEIQVPMKLVMRKTVHEIITSDPPYKYGSPFYNLLYDSYQDLLDKFEKNYTDFTVASPITKLRPIRAKIGTKEDVKRGLRFYAYNTKGDELGNLKQVRKGVVRAAKNISDNENQVATGESNETEFIQIAGGKLEEGMTLIEKKDMKLSLCVGYSMNPYRNDLQSVPIDSLPITKGTLKGLHIDLAYEIPAGFHSCSFIHIGGNFLEGNANNLFLDWGYGLRIPNLELYPYIGGGYDYYDKGKNSSNDCTAWFIHGGVRLNVAVWYPVYLFASGEWNQIVSSTSPYDQLSGTTKKINDKTYKFRNLNGFHLTFGIRFEL